MTRTQLERKIRETLSKVAPEDATHTPLDADLSEAIGLDSLGRLELLAEIEDVYDFRIEDVELSNAKTINDVIDIALRNMRVLEEA